MSGARAVRVLVLAAWALAGAAAHAAAGLDEANELAGAGRYAEALARLDALSEAEASEAQARFLRGVLFAELGRSADAIAVFDALTRDFPRLAEPFNNLAVLYAADGRYEEARDALLVALENNPSYATAHENLGDIYAKMAGLSYARAAELDAANATAQAKGAGIEALFDDPGRRMDPARTTPPPAPAVVAATPIPAASPGGADASALQAKERAAALVASWAAAWSSQDPERYLSHYADAFVPADGVDRAKWERVRRIRLTRPDSISVTVRDIDVELGAGGGAWATFEQSYRSDSYQDQVRKRLDLVSTPGGWKIVGERALP